MKNGKTKKKRGRPSTIRIPEMMLWFIDNQAQQRGIGRSEMVRLMLEEKLELPLGQIRTRTAYHEAGHAVISRILRGSVISASIKDDPGYTKKKTDDGGYFYKQTREATRGRVRHVIVGRHAHILILIAFAGRLAEKVLLGLESDGGESGDMRTIAKIKKKEPAIRVDRLEKMAHMLVWPHADAIKKVAASLLSNETITETHVDRAIAASLKRATPALCVCCRGGVLLADDRVRYLVSR